MKKSNLKKTGICQLRFLYVGLLIVLVAAGLTGCASYIDHGTATIMIQNNESDNAWVKFDSLDGTRSYKMKVKDSDKVLKYSGKIDKGIATVYYDNDGNKKELFSLKSGEQVESGLDTLEKGTLYVIIETDGKCEGGDFDFSLENK